ncbi:hypothetical protein NDU88_006221 [Pleurodeles waltl]|uniref:Uncharacterized protein n=1 Tax=Pleurodeles waltl TaxID=8319 RepID=A0AAV7UM66_PLEWA|nr:hypothetical protein NDU88_006221 [Pleurodeles waltl]
MPSDQSAGKPARQLLFLESLTHHRTTLTTSAPPVSDLPDVTQAPKTDVSMELILQEIMAVGRRLEGMDTKISDLAVELRSIRTDITGFQTKVTRMKHCLSLMEDELNLMPNNDQELQYLQDNLQTSRTRAAGTASASLGSRSWWKARTSKPFS